MKHYLAHNPLRMARYAVLASLRCTKSLVRHRVGPYRERLLATRNLRDSKIGRRALVFGNGPSLTLMNPKKVARLQSQGFDVFGTNGFMLTEIADLVTPNYYVLADPAWFSGSSGSLPSEVASEVVSSNLKLRRANIPIFIPAELARRSNFPNKTYCFNDCEVFFGRYSSNVMRARRFPSIVGMKAIWLADFLGYDKIFIAGIDWGTFKNIRVDAHNQTWTAEEHAYGSGRQLETGAPYRGSIGEFLYQTHNTFQALHKFPKERIVNLDPEGLVDAFSKNHSLDVYH